MAKTRPARKGQTQISSQNAASIEPLQNSESNVSSPISSQNAESTTPSLNQTQTPRRPRTGKKSANGWTVEVIGNLY